MPLDLSSSRQRAISRMALATLALAGLLALACSHLPALRWDMPVTDDAGCTLGAPPDAATRPNPPTEPIRGPEETDPRG